MPDTLTLQTRSTTKTSALAVVTITSFVGPFMMSAVNIAMPDIQRDLSAHAVMLGWIGTAYLLAVAILLVPVGKLADIYGHKRFFQWGILLFSLGSLLCALAWNGLSLILLRAVQGVGGAMLVTTGMAIITSVFPAEERGKAIGISVAAVYIGLSSGPFVGGFMILYWGWRSLFIGVFPLGLACLILTMRYLKGEWRHAAGQRFDLAGSVYYAAALAAFVIGATRFPDGTGILLSIGGVIGLVWFVVHERREPHPVFEVRLFSKNRVFAFSSLAALINYAATFAVTFLISLYLQYIHGLGPRDAGLILIAQPLMQALFSPLAGRMSDRIEPRIIASLGMAITALGLILLNFIGAETPIAFIVFTLILLGFGFGLFSSPNMNAIMGSVEKQHYGIVSGATATMRTVGMMISMAMVTIFFAVLIGEREIAPETYPQFLTSARLTFSVFSIMCIAGIFFSLFRGRLHASGEKTE